MSPFLQQAGAKNNKKEYQLGTKSSMSNIQQQINDATVLFLHLKFNTSDAGKTS